MLRETLSDNAERRYQAEDQPSVVMDTSGDGQEEREGQEEAEGELDETIGEAEGCHALHDPAREDREQRAKDSPQGEDQPSEPPVHWKLCYAHKDWNGFASDKL